MAVSVLGERGCLTCAPFLRLEGRRRSSVHGCGDSVLSGGEAGQQVTNYPAHDTCDAGLFGRLADQGSPSGVG